MAKSRSPASSERQGARERLLRAGEELFHEDGFHAVGIERLIERAGVAKASLYDCFGSKEELARACLARAREARASRVEAALALLPDPRSRLLGMFDLLSSAAAAPGYRGCAFSKAGSDSKPGSARRAECEQARLWTFKLFSALAAEAGARDPESLSRALVILHDGAAVSAQMDADPAAPLAARAVAQALLDAAIGA